MKQMTHRLKQVIRMNEAQIHPNASPLIEGVKVSRNITPSTRAASFRFAKVAMPELYAKAGP